MRTGLQPAMLKTTGTRLAAAGAYDLVLQDYVRKNAAILDSTVFRGTLYELTVMRELHARLGVSRLRQRGAAYDGGIDITGKWDLADVPGVAPDPHEAAIPRSVRCGASRLKPLRRKILDGTARPLDVLVQCKALTTARVGGRLFRELFGAFGAFGARSKVHRNNTVLMLSSPNLLTRNGIAVMNQLELPIIYLRIGLPRIAADGSLRDGYLEHYYENAYAAALLDGCRVQRLIGLHALPL
ncbi:FAFR541Wp [Eremothecium gossypii FDAG1]|nr:FAFR541Wp [Eremothecium gossypii FDAG1]